MKNLSENELNVVRQMANRLIRPNLISIAIGLSEWEFKEGISDVSSPLHEAYYEGLIQAKIDLQEAVIKSAKGGSVAAQQEMKKLMSDNENYLGVN